MPQRTISIYASLLTSVIVIIVVLGGAILTTTLIASRTTIRSLSGTLTEQTIIETRLQLDRFFQPVASTLLVARQWGLSGHLDPTDTDAMIDLFEPILRRSRQASSALIADSRGREFLILQRPDRWLVRQMRRDEWGDEARWIEWTDADPTRITRTETLDYDPRTRPWWHGAIEASQPVQAIAGPTQPADDDLIFWTEPYTFYTTQQPGVSVSVAYDQGDGIDRVIALDILLTDISNFTRSMQITRHGQVLVLSDDGRVVGLPGDAAFNDPAVRKASILKHPSDLPSRLALDATEAFTRQDEEQRTNSLQHGDIPPIRFKSESVAWWGAGQLYALSSSRYFFIAVLVPESDLLGTIPTIRVWVVAITVGVLILAVGWATLLANRVAKPIGALIAESDRISRGDLDEREPVQTEFRELRTLARAHERMRDSIASLLKLEQDLRLARTIQQGTFPKTIPDLPGFDLTGWSRPADETGGDSYDIVGYEMSPQGETVLRADRADKAALMLADATGHGVGPAISVTQLRAMLRIALRDGTDLRTTAKHINEQLCADLPTGRFITAWLGLLDAPSAQLTSFSAGQAPLLHYHAATGEVTTANADVPPLGIIEDLPIPKPQQIALAPGDIFAVLSDGFFEAANARDEQFGSDRVCAILKFSSKLSAQGILDAIRQAVEQFTQGHPIADDQTAIIIKRDA